MPFSLVPVLLLQSINTNKWILQIYLALAAALHISQRIFKTTSLAFETLHNTTQSLSIARKLLGKVPERETLARTFFLHHSS